MFGSGIYAFDTASGELRWKWTTKEFPISELATDANAVYVSLNGLVIAFDPATGKQKWTHRTAKYFPEGLLMFEEGTVVALDLPQGSHPQLAKTGHVFRGLSRAAGVQVWESKTPWKYDRWTAQDGLLFAADHNEHDCWLTVVGLRSGEELWRSETVKSGTCTMPAIGDGMVVLGSSPSEEEIGAASIRAWTVK